MRARKPKHIPERLERYSSVIVQNPELLKGKWVQTLLPKAVNIELDLGCGKGDFIIESARKNPDVLWIGLDNEDVCIALAAQKLYESSLYNAYFVLGDAEKLEDYFSFNELNRIHLNFSSPRPKKKHAPLRLSYAKRLTTYEQLLCDDGQVVLKTDSQPFFDFSLTQFEEAAFDIVELTRDLHAANIKSVKTEYENRLSELGAKIHYCVASPSGEKAADASTQHSMSLVDYLPSDLENMGYVPYGMQEYVQNQINKKKKTNNS